MVKKRGGRRGKSAQEQPPETSEATPSTSQPPITPQTEPIKSPGKADPAPISIQPAAWTQPTKHPQEESKHGQGWGRGQPPQGRGRGQPPQGRGRGRGAYSRVGDQDVGGARPRDWGRGQSLARHGESGDWSGANPKAWGRGQGRQTPTTPGGGAKQEWGGAKPKAWGRGQERQTPTTPGGGAAQEWGGAKSKDWGRGQEKQTPITPGSGAKPQRQESEMFLSEIAELVPFKPGTLGREIRVETNHVRLHLGSLETVYRYDVSIEPEKKPKRMLRQAMQLFQRTFYPNNNPSYDGQKLLYSAKKLPLQDDAASGKVNINLEEGRTQEFKITVKLTGTLNLSPLRKCNLLQNEILGQEEAFQCVEVVFRQAYVNSFINVGRRFYTPSSGNDFSLGCGAQMYLGGYQAAVKGWLPFLNVDVAHKAFTTATPVPKLVMEMFSSRNRPITDPNQLDLQYWQKEQVDEYLKGLKVVYEIPKVPGSKKVYKVNALANPANRERFQHENRTVTVEQYFTLKFHTTLNYPHLPTLWVGNRDKRICIPMEFCTLKEGQPLEGSRLRGTQTSAMINHSATPTHDRKQKIGNVMRTADYNNNPYIEEFGFSIDPNFEILDARVLDAPKLEYADGIVGVQKGSWWAKTFKKGAEINKWTIVGFGAQRDRFERNINELARLIVNYGRGSGMTISNAEQPFEFLRGDLTSLRRYLDIKKNYDLIVVIINPQYKDLYYTVKKEAELRVGCLTQCLKTDTLYKLNETTVRNILLKINCKLNGTNHTLHKMDLISEEPCMIMGADVTHPSPQARTIPSVVAVTASTNLSATAYSTSMYLQKPRSAMSEMIQELESITLSKLRIFQTNSGRIPARLYFFRDGVSDGEFERVKAVEIQAIKRACQSFKHNYQPKLTFIVVKKRHHTRFFPTDGKSSAGDKGNNVPVGTVVDSVITDPTLPNFYLLSHQSIKGVGRPTKYSVLVDENELSADDLERLAYSLCHLYTRCNRGVSYPAPTYFAHLAADRAKGYLHNENVDLENLNQRLVKVKSDFAEKHPMFFS